MIRRYMVGYEVTWVLVEQSVRSEVEVDCVRLERTKTILRRVARLRIVTWIHLSQGMRGFAGDGERDSHTYDI